MRFETTVALSVIWTLQWVEVGAQYYPAATRKYITNSTEYDIATWTPPAFIRDNYRGYYIGRDEEQRPIWVLDIGKWNVKKILASGPAVIHLMDKYIDTLIYRIERSQFLSGYEERTDGWILLIDMDGFSFQEFHSLDTFRYYRERSRVLDSHARFLDSGIVVNAFYAAEILLNAMKPFMGDFFSKMDVYGTNKEVWVHRVLQKIPRKVLPRKYGGFNNGPFY